MKRYTTAAGIPSDYSSRVKSLRARHDLSQARLADLLGVSFPTVSRWESGHVHPSPALWQRIAEMELFGLDTAGSRDGARSQAREAAGAYVPDT